MAITIFNIPLILASLKQIFLGVKYIITLKRVKFKVKILKMAELLKN